MTWPDDLEQAMRAFLADVDGYTAEMNEVEAGFHRLASELEGTRPDVLLHYLADQPPSVVRGLLVRLKDSRGK